MLDRSPDLSEGSQKRFNTTTAKVLDQLVLICNAAPAYRIQQCPIADKFPFSALGGVRGSARHQLTYKAPDLAILCRLY